MRRDDGVDDRSRLVAARLRAQVEPSHDFVDVAHRDRLAVGQNDDRIREACNLGDRMADVDDRDGEVVAQQFDVTQHFVAPRDVERCQRLIHEQQPRLRQQRAADGNSLLLAARKCVGQAVQQ